MSACSSVEPISINEYTNQSAKLISEEYISSEQQTSYNRSTESQFDIKILLEKNLVGKKILQTYKEQQNIFYGLLYLILLWIVFKFWKSPIQNWKETTYMYIHTNIWTFIFYNFYSQNFKIWTENGSEYFQYFKLFFASTAKVIGSRKKKIFISVNTISQNSSTFESKK